MAWVCRSGHGHGEQCVTAGRQLRDQHEQSAEHLDHAREETEPLSEPDLLEDTDPFAPTGKLAPTDEQEGNAHAPTQNPIPQCVARFAGLFEHLHLDTATQR
jgi:hypothetical protein